MNHLWSVFQNARSYSDFLAKFASEDQANRWAKYRSQVAVSDVQGKLLESFKRKINVLCMAGAWCGDCVQQCPIFDVFEEMSSAIEVRYIDRDQDHGLQEELTICGGARVPQFVFLSEDGFFVGRNGDRTLSRYRAIAAAQMGAACPTGISTGDEDPVLTDVVQDWLDELERIHWILRLSPRLRQRHGD